MKFFSFQLEEFTKENSENDFESSPAKKICLVHHLPVLQYMLENTNIETLFFPIRSNQNLLGIDRYMRHQKHIRKKLNTCRSKLANICPFNNPG